MDLVITSYGSLVRVPGLLKVAWHLAVLDEAQAIKNPGAKQTRAAKQLDASARIALTGTPVENRLGDLWSIFDFINPGLLGSSKEFASFTKRLAARPHNPYAPLRELVRPYILRRLKTDKTVIADLPDKTEVKAFCLLTRTQAALYQQAVAELKAELEGVDGIKRKGVVLAFLMRFKQICNHPSQWLGDGAWREADSGKFARLREIAEVIAAKQEKVLVFTQFREVTAPLAAFLGSVFGRPGPRAARRDRGEEAPGAGAAISGRRNRPVLRALAQGRRLRPEPHGGVARDPLRPLVEPGGREPGHGPRLPHRPDQERAGAQIRVPRDGRGEDRPADRIEAAAVAGSAGGRRRSAADRDDERRAAEARGARSPRAPLRRRDRWTTTTMETLRARRRAAASGGSRGGAASTKKGQTLSPVVIDGRNIAKTFWGKAWCDNLERYSDYANRLPRGRTYVRNGSVVDLQIAPGAVTALVSGSDLYEVARQGRCRSEGPLGRHLRGLRGRDRFPRRVAAGTVFRARDGDASARRRRVSFPSPKEITFTCSCPDWASMCKHVAAVLYGIGARLDEKPDLLFTLRKVNHEDLIAKAGTSLSRTRKGAAVGRVLDTGDLSEIFGIEIAQVTTPRTPARAKLASPTRRTAASKASRSKKAAASPRKRKTR